MAYEIDRRDLKVVAYFIGAAFLIAGVAFYFLSQMYFDDRAEDGIVFTAQHIMDVRVAFVVMLAILCGGVQLAITSPRLVGHGLALLAGLAAAVASAPLFNDANVNLVLPIAMVITGLLFIQLARKSFMDRSRTAWAFLVAMCGVFSVVMLFGSTKIRDHGHVQLYYAMIVPALLAVATVALALVRREYTER